MARRSVVLPLPDGPRSATTSPLRRSNETPFRMSFSPRRLWTSETTRLASLMQAHPQAQRDGEARAHQDHVDDRERCNGVDGPRRPERDDERTDHLGSRAEQVHRRGIFADEDHEDEEEAPEEPEPHQGERDPPSDLPLRRPRHERRFFQLRTDLQERARDEPHPVREPDDRVGDPDREEGAAKRRDRLEEQEQPEECEARDETRHPSRQHHQVVDRLGEEALRAVRRERNHGVAHDRDGAADDADDEGIHDPADEVRIVEKVLEMLEGQDLGQADAFAQEVTRERSSAPESGTPTVTKSHMTTSAKATQRNPPSGSGLRAIPFPRTETNRAATPRSRRCRKTSGKAIAMMTTATTAISWYEGTPRRFVNL